MTTIRYPQSPYQDKCWNCQAKSMSQMDPLKIKRSDFKVKTLLFLNSDPVKRSVMKNRTKKNLKFMRLLFWVLKNNLKILQKSTFLKKKFFFWQKSQKRFYALFWPFIGHFHFYSSIFMNIWVCQKIFNKKSNKVQISFWFHLILKIRTRITRKN